MRKDKSIGYQTTVKLTYLRVIHRPGEIVGRMKNRSKLERREVQKCQNDDEQQVDDQQRGEKQHID